jgi:hypothetical protein
VPHLDRSEDSQLQPRAPPPAEPPGATLHRLRVPGRGPFYGPFTARAYNRERANFFAAIPIARRGADPSRMPATDRECDMAMQTSNLIGRAR